MVLFRFFTLPLLPVQPEASLTSGVLVLPIKWDKVKNLDRAKCWVNGSGGCANESHFEELEVVPCSEHLYMQSLGFRQF